MEELRSRFSLALSWYRLRLGPHFLNALLERLHQVNYLAMRWSFWCRRYTPGNSSGVEGGSRTYRAVGGKICFGF